MFLSLFVYYPFCGHLYLFGSGLYLGCFRKRFLHVYLVFPPLRAWLASTLLYYLCHFNENYVIVFLFLDWILGLGWFGCFWNFSLIPPFYLAAYSVLLLLLFHCWISLGWVCGGKLHTFSTSFLCLVLFIFGLVFTSMPVECYCRYCSPWQFSICFCYGF